MKISYNWLKLYISEIPEPQKLRDIFTYHLCEVESIEEKREGNNKDYIFDINILPNRAHDLLSHQGVARELASLLNIKYNDVTLKYKVPPLRKSFAGQAELKIKVESQKCRRYMGRIIRNIKVNSSFDWIKMYLNFIGEREINNIVDSANITMFDIGQPIHCFDLDKVSGSLIIRDAKKGEEMTTLDNKKVILDHNDLVIADEKNILAIAGIKGGKIAEVDKNTKNIIIEVANFDPISIRKTSKRLGIQTEASKRFENNLSSLLCEDAMLEISNLFLEYGFAEIENIVDIYNIKQLNRKLFFNALKISKILGKEIQKDEIRDILNRYNFNYKEEDNIFEIEIPKMRLDLEIEEDMAEEVGRIIGYDKIISKIPNINFKTKENKIYEMIQKSKKYLLSLGYSEVMTYVFADKGEVEVMKSASDKKFLRNNLSDGIKESIEFNQKNLILLNMEDIKVFEIGTVFLKNKEEMHICFGDKKNVTESSLVEFYKNIPLKFFQEMPQSLENLRQDSKEQKFKMWSLFPFIVRDISLWVSGDVDKQNIENIIKENMGDLVIHGPYLFDEFKKDERTSYAFRLIFQSDNKTLTDEEVNIYIKKIHNELIQKGFELR